MSIPFLQPAPLYFEFSFLGKELRPGAGMATRSAKAPAGSPVFSGGAKDFRKEKRRACASALPMERTPPWGFAKRGAVPAPRRGFPSIRASNLSAKVKKGKLFCKYF